MRTTFISSFMKIFFILLIFSFMITKAFALSYEKLFIKEGSLIEYPFNKPVKVSAQAQPDEQDRECKIMPGDSLKIKSVSPKYAMLANSFNKVLLVAEALVEKQTLKSLSAQEKGTCPGGANLAVEVLCDVNWDRGDLPFEVIENCKWYPNVPTACFFVDC